MGQICEPPSFPEGAALSPRGGDPRPFRSITRSLRLIAGAYGSRTSKAEQHYKAAGIHLIEAKKRIEDGGERITWTAFITGHCGLGRSRAYELLAIADGRITVAEVREKNASSKREARARKTMSSGQIVRYVADTSAPAAEVPATASASSPHETLRASLIERVQQATPAELEWLEKAMSIGLARSGAGHFEHALRRPAS